MTARDLERKGVALEPKLTFKSAEPLDAATVATLKAHKADLLRDLIAPDTVPRLPWQLERLVVAASSGVLQATVPGVPDVGATSWPGPAPISPATVTRPWRDCGRSIEPGREQTTVARLQAGAWRLTYDRTRGADTARG